jgi:hypothetical protein
MTHTIGLELSKLNRDTIRELDDWLTSTTNPHYKKFAKHKAYITLPEHVCTQIGLFAHDTSMAKAMPILIENKFVDDEFHRTFGKDIEQAIVLPRTTSRNVIGMSGKLRKALDVDNLVGSELRITFDTHGPSGVKHRMLILGLE